MDLPLELPDGAAVLPVFEAVRHLGVSMVATTYCCIADFAGVFHCWVELPLLGQGHSIRFHQSLHWDPINREVS